MLDSCATKRYGYKAYTTRVYSQLTQSTNKYERMVYGVLRAWRASYDRIVSKCNVFASTVARATVALEWGISVVFAACLYILLF